MWQGKRTGVREGNEWPGPAQSCHGWISLYNDDGCDLYFLSIILVLKWRKDYEVANSEAVRLQT